MTLHFCHFLSPAVSFFGLRCSGVWTTFFRILLETLGGGVVEVWEIKIVLRPSYASQ